MAFGGRRGEPMAQGGAAAQHMRVRRMAPAWAQKYHAQEPLGTADGPRVAGHPRCACTVRYERQADHRARRRARGVPARSGVKHFSLAPFEKPFLDFSQLKSHKQSIPKF
jgi:hypothetical protein